MYKTIFYGHNISVLKYIRINLEQEIFDCSLVVYFMSKGVACQTEMFNESSFHQNKIERWWLENYHLKSIILPQLKEPHLSPSLSFLFNKTLEKVSISWIIEVDSVTRLVKDGVLKAIQWKLARYQHRFHEYRYEWNSWFMHIFLNGLQAYMIRQTGTQRMNVHPIIGLIFRFIVPSEL